MADPFIIEELGNQPKRIELRDFDLPHGRARKEAAFETGGPLETNEIWLEGREEPVLHTKQVRNRPIVIKGHFRDHLWGEEGHAREMRDRFEEMKRRARPQHVIWGTMKFLVSMSETKFGVEDDYNITYEISFRVFRDLTQPTRARKSAEVPVPSDLVAQIRALMEARRIAMELEFVATTVALALSQGFSQLDAALDVTEEAAKRYEEASDRAKTFPDEIRAKCQHAKDRVDAIQFIVEGSSDADVLTRTDADSTAAWWRARSETSIACLEAHDALISIQAAALQNARRTSRLYQVKPGDTLESIALSELGNTARSSELSVRQQDLVPGKFIRIPEGA